MSKSARRLGRGLSSLISDYAKDPDPDEAGPVMSQPPRKIDQSQPESRGPGHEEHADPAHEVQARMIPVAELTPNPHQPRGPITDEGIETIKQSIKQSGILQPITVRQTIDKYEIIAGERRWRAARALGLQTVPVVIRQANDEQMLEWALIENIQREDLNPIDRASAYRHFCDRFNLRPEEVAERLGEDRSTIVNYLRILNLPQDIQALVVDGRISNGHARSLAGVQDPKEQSRLAQTVVDKQLSVRALEELIRNRRQAGPQQTESESVPKRMKSPLIVDLERRFEQTLKTRVAIKEGKRRGSGRIVIDYYSLDDFDHIAERLGVDMEQA